MFEQMIPHRQRACSGCDQPFQPGDEVITQLRDLTRSDRCTTCGPQEGEWSEWRSQVPIVEEEPRKVLSGEERALELLRERCDNPDGYLLAIYLERLGRLHRYRRVKGKDPLLFEDVETGEVVQVTPDADPEAAQRLIEELQLGLDDTRTCLESSESCDQCKASHENSECNTPAAKSIFLQ